MSLVAELKRRNVFKVGAAYLALGWVIVQVTATVAPFLRLPDWTVPMVVWVGAVGFPCVLIFSWVYELTPEGLRRETEVAAEASITRETSRRLDYLIIALLLLAIALFAFGQLRGAPAPDGPTPGDGAGAAAAQPAGSPASPAGEAVAAPGSAAPVAADEKSIAVLPFADMSADKSQEYMSDGIAEELLNLLAKVPELRVIARTSSFSYKGKDTKLADVARELGVAHILEGSVRTSGNRVRITAQLIRASDSTHIWSETYDRTLDDIFAVQDEIAGAVVGQLKIALLGAAPKAHAADPKAYALLLQARQLRRIMASADATSKAEVLVDQALAIDPGYAELWAEKSGIAHTQASNGLRPIAEGVKLSRESAQKALALDPELAAAHAQIGRLAWEYDNDPAAAAAAIERALALAPANPVVLSAAGNLALGLGRTDQARALADYVLARDPVNPASQHWRGYVDLYSRNYAGAIEDFRAALVLSPERIGARFFIGAALLLNGDAAGAMAEFEREHSGIWRSLGLALGYQATGRLAEAGAVLKVLETDEADSWAYNLAYVHAMRGDGDAAFAWLDRAVEHRDPGLSDVAVDPLFGNLHDDPRWLPFLSRIGRAPEQLAAIRLDVKLP